MRNRGFKRCEGIFGPKVWHSNSKYRRTIWQCNNKFKGEKKCATPHLDEETLKRLFVEAFNSLIEDKEAIISGYDAIIQACGAQQSTDLLSTQQIMLPLYLRMVQNCLGIYKSSGIARNNGGVFCFRA